VDPEPLTGRGLRGGRRWPWNGAQYGRRPVAASGCCVNAAQRAKAGRRVGVRLLDGHATCLHLARLPEKCTTEDRALLVCFVHARAAGRAYW